MASSAPRRFASRYGPFAVVAGASEGIGRAFARRIAAAGVDLVLVARRAGPLEALAATIRSETGRDVRTLALDVGDIDGVATLVRHTRDIEVGLLVVNAAFSPIGPFLDRPLEDHLRALDVNARAPLLLVHPFGKAMAGRRRGGIVLMSSLAGFQGTPLASAYAATKAFGRVLGESLFEELRERGVDVLACCAGATRTPGYESSGAARAARLAPRPQDPEEVAAEALHALGTGPSIVTGRGNRVAAFVMGRLLTRRRAVAIMAREMRRRYGRARVSAS